MTIPALIMWAVVLVVGIPSMWRNPTAAALVLTWLAAQGLYLITGNNLPLDFYVVPDILVIAVILTKPEASNLRPYRSAWHQLNCFLLERSVADRIVMLIFPVMWAIYVAELHPYYKWWALYYLVIIQFLATGWEAYQSWRCDADAAHDQSTPPNALLVASRSGGYG